MGPDKSGNVSNKYVIVFPCAHLLKKKLLKTIVMASTTCDSGFRREFQISDSEMPRSNSSCAKNSIRSHESVKQSERIFVGVAASRARGGGVVRVNKAAPVCDKTFSAQL